MHLMFIYISSSKVFQILNLLDFSFKVDWIKLFLRNFCQFLSCPLRGFSSKGGRGEYSFFSPLMWTEKSSPAVFDNNSVLNPQKLLQLWGFVYASKYNEMLDLCRVEKPGICRWWVVVRDEPICSLVRHHCWRDRWFISMTACRVCCTYTTFLTTCINATSQSICYWKTRLWSCKKHNATPEGKREKMMRNILLCARWKFERHYLVAVWLAFCLVDLLQINLCCSTRAWWLCDQSQQMRVIPYRGRVGHIG